MSEDLNEIAVKAKKLYEENLEIKKADIFEKQKHQAMIFIGISNDECSAPNLWSEYVEKVSSLIKDEGFYIAVLFEQFNEDVKRPPYAIVFNVCGNFMKKILKYFPSIR